MDNESQTGQKDRVIQSSHVKGGSITEQNGKFGKIQRASSEDDDDNNDDDMSSAQDVEDEENGVVPPPPTHQEKRREREEESHTSYGKKDTNKVDSKRILHRQLQTHGMRAGGAHQYSLSRRVGLRTGGQ